MRRWSEEEFGMTCGDMDDDKTAFRVAYAEALRARRREEALETLVRRLLEAREMGANFANMQAMARDAGIET